MQPLVSILIPVFNRELMVGDAIRSALEQTFTDIEVVVVDNASTDGTWEVCQRFAKQDPRVRIHRNPENMGPVRNWQRCAELAQGEFSKIIFSDDTIEPEFLNKTIPLLRDARVGFVFTKTLAGNTKANAKTVYNCLSQSGVYSSRRFIVESLCGGDVPCSPGCALFRTKDLRSNLNSKLASPTITDFERHGAGPDLLIFLLTAIQYEKIGYVNESLSFFRAHVTSISVSAVRPYLLGCYRQAKLWFAEEYLSHKAIKLMFSREWHNECKEAARIPLHAFTEKYTDNKYNIGLCYLMYASLGYRLRKWIFSVLL